MESSAPGARYGDLKVGQGSSPILADVVTVGCSSGRLNRFGNNIIEFPNSSGFHVITCISSMSSTWNKDDICLTRNSFTSVSATLILTIDIEIEIATLQLGTLTQILPAVLVHHLPHHLVGLLVPAHIRQDGLFYVLIFSTLPKPQFSAELGSTLITG